MPPVIFRERVTLYTITTYHPLPSSVSTIYTSGSSTILLIWTSYKKIWSARWRCMV